MHFDITFLSEFDWKVKLKEDPTKGSYEIDLKSKLSRKTADFDAW